MQSLRKHDMPPQSRGYASSVSTIDTTAVQLVASGHLSGAWDLEELDALGAWQWVAYSCQGIESGLPAQQTYYLGLW